MKIETGKTWSFYTAFHDESYIKWHDTRKNVVLKEPKESREYRIENKNGKEIVVYQIDGGLIKDNNVLKCDNGVLTEDDVLFLIELKGADYIHALEQLLSTINLLIVRRQLKVSSLNTRIVLSKMNIPGIISTQEKKLTKLLKLRNGNHVKQCQVLKDTI